MLTSERTKKAVTPIRVLLIEDDADDQQLVKDYLTRNGRGGISVEYADRLSTGLHRLSLGNFDAVLLDLFLPDSEGYETFTRAHAQDPRVPIVILTGLDDEELGSRAVRDGAQDYLPKQNLSAEVLTRAIRYAAQRKEADEQLRQAQKMEAIGQLAGGIAHDFNNLLGVILGNAEILQCCALHGDVPPRAVARICQAAKSAASLTAQLLTFSRMQAPRVTVFKPNDAVNQAGELLRHLLRESITLNIRTDPEAGRVHADPGQFEQIILNLAVNARDAMPNGGTLTIETRNAELDEAYFGEPGSAGPGQYVMLAVSDTGTGMDAKTQAQIFEPFFTTKPQGTGLGLATVRGVVTQTNGHISVYSEPGHGTTMKVYLPRVREEGETAVAGTTPGKSWRGTETILLVEDNIDLREVSREFLAAAGYTVLEAGSFDEALAVARKHRAIIHLLLTDVVLPSGTGREIAIELTAARPEIAVLYMSGYTDSIVAQHGVREPGIVLLQKPFTRNQLLSFVRETLDAQTGRPVAERLVPAGPVRVKLASTADGASASAAAATAKNAIEKQSA